MGRSSSRRPRVVVAAALIALPLLVGCQRAALFGRFFVMSFGSLAKEPREVPNKLEDPYVPKARLVVTWVGHATVLVQMHDKFVLTDPVFTETVGNLSRRLVEPGLDVASLPKIDVVAISHLHFDHLSLGSLDLLEDRYAHLVVPEGGAVYVPENPILPYELRSWESHEFEGLRVTAVPVEHVGFRYGGDLAWATTGFTGYVFEYGGQKVYFGGDTAKSPWMFSATARRFPNLDLAILPIAPIHPREFMEHTHVDPSESLGIFRDLGAKRMLAMHFDTFANSLDAFGEAPRRLRELGEKSGLDADELIILPHGGQKVIVP